MRLWFRIWRWIASAIFHLLWWPRLEGRENFPSGPYLIAANHRSWFDPPLVSVLTTWREIGFLAKAELFSGFLLGRFIWSLNARPIRRGGIDRTAIRHIQELLNKGVPILVFPEGTRSRTGVMLPPKPGVGRLARRCEIPVVPVYISGNFRVGRAPFRWGRLRMRAGAPISVEEIRSLGDDKEGYRALSRLMMERICALSDSPARDRAAALGGGDRAGRQNAN